MDALVLLVVRLQVESEPAHVTHVSSPVKLCVLSVLHLVGVGVLVVLHLDDPQDVHVLHAVASHANCVCGRILHRGATIELAGALNLALKELDGPIDSVLVAALVVVVVGAGLEDFIILGFKIYGLGVD